MSPAATVSGGRGRRAASPDPPVPGRPGAATLTVMAARLADIAAQAGVSEATVSRVLNDRPGVADSTRQAVLTALDLLGYERPARLRAHDAGLVGLVVPELHN